MTEHEKELRDYFDEKQAENNTVPFILDTGQTVHLECCSLYTSNRLYFTMGEGIYLASNLSIPKTLYDEFKEFREINLKVNDVTEKTMNRYDTLLEKLKIYTEDKQNNG